MGLKPGILHVFIYEVSLILSIIIHEKTEVPFSECWKLLKVTESKVEFNSILFHGFMILYMLLGCWITTGDSTYLGCFELLFLFGELGYPWTTRVPCRGAQGTQRQAENLCMQQPFWPCELFPPDTSLAALRG